MPNKITIGQYIPGDSLIHKLDPRIKILATLFYMITVFMIEDMILFIPLFILIFISVKISGVKLSLLIKGLKSIILILVITTVFNLFLTPGRILFSIGPLDVTYEGLYRSIFIVIRIILLIMGTSLMTLTTSPMDLTYGLEKLFGPLKKINFPVSEFALMISIALRFIPTLYEESEKIMNAQKSRGADFESGNIINRAKNMIPLLVPLFLNSMDRADELSTAMEARCYRPGEDRTKLNEMNIDKTDILVSIILGIFFIIISMVRFI